VEVKKSKSKNPTLIYIFAALSIIFLQRIKLLACMNFVVKIKEISFKVLKDIQCPQPHEGNNERSQGYEVIHATKCNV
jgi:hypothetical protein